MRLDLRVFLAATDEVLDNFLVIVQTKRPHAPLPSSLYALLRPWWGLFLSASGIWDCVGIARYVAKSLYGSPGDFLHLCGLVQALQSTHGEILTLKRSVTAIDQKDTPVVPHGSRRSTLLCVTAIDQENDEIVAV